MSRAVVDPTMCIGCNSCKSVCPVDAICVRAEGFAFANEKCITCGACTLVCPVQCISIDSIKKWYEVAKAHNIKSINISEEKDNE